MSEKCTTCQELERELKEWKDGILHLDEEGNIVRENTPVGSVIIKEEDSIEKTGDTSYYAVEIGGREYTLTGEYDSNSDHTSWDIIALDDGDVPKGILEKALELLNNMS